MQKIILTKKDLLDNNEVSNNYYKVIEDMTEGLLNSEWYYPPQNWIELDCGVEIENLNVNNLRYNLRKVEIEDFMEWYYDSVFMSHLKCKGEQCSQWRYCDVEQSFEKNVVYEFNKIMHEGPYSFKDDDLREILNDSFNTVMGQWEYSYLMDDSFIKWFNNILDDYYNTVKKEIDYWIRDEYVSIESEAYFNNEDYVNKKIYKDGEFEYMIY